jgi:hypothetical protein
MMLFKTIKKKEKNYKIDIERTISVEIDIVDELNRSIIEQLLFISIENTDYFEYFHSNQCIGGVLLSVSSLFIGELENEEIIDIFSPDYKYHQLMWIKV